MMQHTHLTSTIGHTHYESINLLFLVKNMNYKLTFQIQEVLKNYRTRPAVPFSGILYIYIKSDKLYGIPVKECITR
jgi:hypothetical protein